MGRSLKIFSLSLICCGILGLLAPAQAGAGDLSDPLVSQSWVEHRLDELLSPVEEELAGLEQRIRSISGNTAVDIQLRIGKTTASVNGETKTLDAAPRIVEAGYTLVPIRFVAEALGIQVEWLPESKQIRFFDQNTEMLLTVGSKDRPHQRPGAQHGLSPHHRQPIQPGPHPGAYPLRRGSLWLQPGLGAEERRHRDCIHQTLG